MDSTATVQYSLSNEVGTFNRTIQPGQVDIFTDLPLTLRQIGSGIQNKAIRIIADGDVVVYGINKQTWSTDGFLAFPTDVIGQEYYTSHYYPGTCQFLCLFSLTIWNIAVVVTLNDEVFTVE